MSLLQKCEKEVFFDCLESDVEVLLTPKKEITKVEFWCPMCAKFFNPMKIISKNTILGQQVKCPDCNVVRFLYPIKR